MSRSRSAALAAVLVALAALAGPVPAGAEPAKQEWRVTTVAGIGESGFSGDGGPATEARLGGSPAYGPKLKIAADGTMYLAEWENHRLRRITPDGVIGTVPGTTTRIGSVRSVAIAGDGTVYLGNGTDIRRLGPNGTTEVVVPEDDGLLNDIAVDEAGALYYGTYFYDDQDRRKSAIVRLDRSGATRTVVEVRADLQTIAADAGGTVYYTTGDLRPDSNLVHAVGANGATRTVVTLPKGHLAGSVRIGPDGTPHVVDVSQGQVFRFDARGALTPVGPALTGWVGDFAFGPDGTLHVVVGSTVRKVERSSGGEKAPEASSWDGEPGTVHRVAGTGMATRTGVTGLSVPAVAEDGTVYVAETRRNLVHAIGRDGKVTRFAGTGAYPDQDYRPGGRTADKVELAAPHAVAVGDDGTVYIETRDAILRVTRDRKVDVVTEVDLVTWQTTRPDLMPQLSVDEHGTVFYTAAAGPIEGVIRSVTDGGAPEDVAGKAEGGLLPGKYSEGKPAKDGTLQSPTAISVGADSTIYFVETSSGGAVHAVRAVRPDGVLVTVAGNADTRLGGDGGFAGDGGQAKKATLNNPRGVAAGPDGSFYIADTYNGRVRRVADGVITTIAGTGRRAETGDDGPAVKASLLDPSGLAIGDDGTVYVTSANSSRVRVIAPDGTISTLADLHIPASDIPLADIDKLAAAPDGSAYVSDLQTLSAFGPDGSARPVPGLSGQGPVAAAPDGSVYQLIQVYAQGAKAGEYPAQLWQRFPDGTVLRVAADQPMTGARDLAVGPKGEIYVATEAKLFPLGGEAPLLSIEDGSSGGSDDGFQDIAVGADGTPYAVYDDQVVALRDGKPEIVAGNGDTYSTTEDEEAEDGGPARDASLNEPRAVAVDRDGTLFIATYEGLRRVRDGMIETLDIGVEDPRQLALTPSGDLYVANREQVFVVVQPGKVEVDHSSWTWIWFTAGGLALVAAAGAGLVWWRRRMAAIDADYEAAVQAADQDDTPGTKDE